MGAAPDPGAMADWPGIIAANVAPYMNATVQIVDPQTSVITTPYDPATDTGGDSTPLVIRQGPAFIQKIRRPLRVPGPNEWSSTHEFSITMALDNTVPLVSKGMQIIVLDGGREKDLEALTYIVTMSADSSWAPLSTYMCIAEIVSKGATP